mmetsp:Transcript_76661/g.213082  ORF Transcript_76661/g.213082 Transcript_76661/m.213082 type:complete len:140 (+) Transcript_76661:96-515(+)
MSSLQQAIANDIARGQSRGNPVVQNHRSQRDDGNIHRELEERRKAEADARKLQRLAEGGRAGGFNDRQEATKASRRPQDEGGYDDFGRRVSARQFLRHFFRRACSSEAWGPRSRGHRKPDTIRSRSSVFAFGAFIGSAF